VAKLFAMGYSWSGNNSHLQASVGAFKMLQDYDMQPHGVNSASEDLNGISPSVVSETLFIKRLIDSGQNSPKCMCMYFKRDSLTLLIAVKTLRNACACTSTTLSYRSAYNPSTINVGQTSSLHTFY
jgi:hypothetical protein